MSGELRRRMTNTKPRERTGPMMTNSAAALVMKRAQRVRATRISETARNTGSFMVADRSASGRISGVIVGTTGHQGGATADPARVVAWRIRNALAAPPLGVVTIYDAAGKAIATVNPVTRERTPL
jgi:hypothetical protein